jgi:beta-1,4-mannosyl-glycoprotein beta-1,4-N-acetylglucosaminyltransferase
MLYVHLSTLSEYVDRFVIGHCNVTFTNQPTTGMTLSPFEKEIMSYSDQILFWFIDLPSLPLATSKWRDEPAWRREATARNFLIEGVKQFHPFRQDLVLLTDVDELVTRRAIDFVRRDPPGHYYNLYGRLYHYSFRWVVGEWERPMVIRFGAFRMPLDDYKFVKFIRRFPEDLHHHCSFCFPRVSDVVGKLVSFSHTEFSQGKFRDPNYVLARIFCGYGVLPPQWKMPEVLKPVEFDANDIFVPDDPRVAFLKQRVGFQDLDSLHLNRSLFDLYRPPNCTYDFASGIQIQP